MQTIYKIRRNILKKIVPEVYWPAKINVGDVPVQIRGAPYSYGVKKLLSNDVNSYEKAEVFLCQKAIHEEDIVIEMGSSIGILTCWVSQMVGKKGHVFAAEADRDLTIYSKTWLEKLGNISVINAYSFPLYNKVNLKIKFQNDFGSLGGKVSYLLYDQTDNTYQDLLFLSTIELNYRVASNVLICDIEGSEEIILSHKPNFPNYLRSIIIELHPSIYGYNKLFDIISVIKDEGYTLNASMDNVYWFERMHTI